MQVVFAKSVQGYSHIRRENEVENLQLGRKFPCQDKSFAGVIESNDGIKFTFLSACDGHGGAAYFRSETGADFAIQVLKDILTRNMKRINELAISGEYQKIKEQLALAITKRWREKVIEDISNNPITETEYSFLQIEKPEIVEKYKNGKDLCSIYGCTMISYFATDKFWYALQIGDGDFAISYDGKLFELPMPEDENCFLNQTTSLCDDDAVKEFRFIAGDKLPKFVFCSTDGIANSFKDTNSLLNNFYLPVSQLFNEEDQYSKCRVCTNSVCNPKCRFELCKQEIENYLPSLSKKGSGDDVSLVFAAEMDNKKIQAILDYLRGVKLYSNGQKGKGISLLRMASTLNNSKAQERLGDIYVNASIRCEKKDAFVFKDQAKKYFQDALKNTEDKESLQKKLDSLEDIK